MSASRWLICCTFSFSGNQNRPVRVLPDALLFVQAATKSMQKCLSPCGGHLLCRVSVTSRIFLILMGIRPCVKGPDLAVCLARKKPKNKTTFATSTTGEAHKSPGSCGGSVGIESDQSLPELRLPPFEPDMPSAAQSFLLLCFLCRYKENDVAVGQPRRF